MAKTEERRIDPSGGKSGASPSGPGRNRANSADNQPDNSEEMAGATLVSHVVGSDVAHELARSLDPDCAPRLSARRGERLRAWCAAR